MMRHLLLSNQNALKIYLETNKCSILTSAKFQVICCTETVFLERVLLLYGHTSYIQTLRVLALITLLSEQPDLGLHCMFMYIQTLRDLALITLLSEQPDLGLHCMFMYIQTLWDLALITLLSEQPDLGLHCMFMYIQTL